MSVYKTRGKRYGKAYLFIFFKGECCIEEIEGEVCGQLKLLKGRESIPKSDMGVLSSLFAED